MSRFWTRLIKQYRLLAQESMAKYGGRCRVEPVEGGWPPKAVVSVEIPDTARAKAWYQFADYAEALKVRAGALSRRLICVEGVAWRVRSARADDRRSVAS